MKNNNYKPQGRVGLFDEQMRLQRLAVKSNPLKQSSRNCSFFFGDTLEVKALIVNEEMMANAGFVPVSIQRNTPEENKKIKF